MSIDKIKGVLAQKLKLSQTKHLDLIDISVTNENWQILLQRLYNNKKISGCIL